MTVSAAIRRSWFNPMITLSSVKDKAPMCLVGNDYLDMAQSIDDCRYAAQFQIELSEEGDPLALPARSIAACREYIAWIDNNSEGE